MRKMLHHVKDRVSEVVNAASREVALSPLPKVTARSRRFIERHTDLARALHLAELQRHDVDILRAPCREAQDFARRKHNCHRFSKQDAPRTTEATARAGTIPPPGERDTPNCNSNAPRTTQIALPRQIWPGVGVMPTALIIDAGRSPVGLPPFPPADSIPRPRDPDLDK